MLPTLGGQNTLRGYPDFRFHDRDLVAVNVESRWAVSTQVDGAVFLDAGTVDYCVRAAQNFKGCATTRTTMGRHLRAKIRSIDGKPLALRRARSFQTRA